MDTYCHMMSRPNNDGRRLGAYLERARRERGIDAPALAERAGIRVDRFSLAETGVVTLTDSELAQVAAALSLSETVLLEEAGLITHIHVRRRRRLCDER